MASFINESKERRTLMNVKLRKRHRYMWMVLGIALPLLCLEAIENIPKDVIADIPRHSCTLVGGVCGISESDTEGSIIVNPNIQNSVISLSVNGPLKSAFTLVYLSSDQQVNEEAQLIGSIEGMGTYDFEVSENHSFGDNPYLVIVDKLNSTTLYHKSLNLP